MANCSSLLAMNKMTKTNVGPCSSDGCSVVHYNPSSRKECDKAASGNGPFGALFQIYRVLAICFVLDRKALKVLERE